MRDLLKKFVLGTSAAMFVAMFTLSSVQAGDGHRQSYAAPTYSYKTVTKWVHEEVAYKTQVVRYKPCGTPYVAWETRTKTVKVPVTYRVKVYH